MEIPAGDDVEALQTLLKETGAVEINITEKH
jgi:hypothetical protein